MKYHLAHALAVAGLTLGSCVPPGATPDEPAPEALEPTFAPTGTPPAGASTEPDDGTPTPTASPSPDATATTDPPATATPTDPTDSTPTPTPTTAPEPAVTTSQVSDATGDVQTRRPAQSPPDHADLVGAELTRAGDTLRLEVDLLGGAPDTARDDNHTQNVAAFYDTDGDGQIDYETWANLSSTGWGTSWFDNVEGRARFGADDEVEVEVVDGVLVLTFPARLVGDAPTFRWSLASEWGTYEDLQLGLTARDFAGSDDPAVHPG